MAPSQPIRRKLQSSTKSVSIPDKLYFRIGDVSSLCDLPAYVLRFWETEFPQLKPNKGGTGQRLYRKRDVEMVLEIKRLLYEEGFTIVGARRSLLEKRRALAAMEPADREATAHREKKLSKGRAGSLVVDPEKRAKPNTMKSTPVAGSKFATSAPNATAPPRIKDLRQEMRDLLKLLGSDSPEPKASSEPIKQDKTKTRSKNSEPTLFE